MAQNVYRGHIGGKDDKPTVRISPKRSKDTRTVSSKDKQRSLPFHSFSDGFSNFFDSSFDFLLFHHFLSVRYISGSG